MHQLRTIEIDNIKPKVDISHSHNSNHNQHKSAALPASKQAASEKVRAKVKTADGSKSLGGAAAKFKKERDAMASLLG